MNNEPLTTDPRLESIRLKKDASGYRFLSLADGRVIPAGIAALAAGPDAWLREYRMKCRDCGEMFPAYRMECGGQFCDDCACADIED